MMTLTRRALSLLTLTLGMGCSSTATLRGEVVPREALATVLVLSEGEVVDEVRPNRRTGEFALVVPPGTYDILISADGFLPSDEHAGIEVAAGEDVDLGATVLFRAGTGSIRGMVVPTDATARVSALQFGAVVASVESVGGELLLVGLPVGSYDLAVTAPGYARWDSTAPIAVREGETTMLDPIELTVSEAPTGTLTGTVDPPDAHATIAASLGGVPVASAASDEDGRFELSSLEVGSYALTVEADGFSRARLTATVIANDVTDVGTVSLTRPARILQGTVRDLDEGVPVPGVTVRVDGVEDTTGPDGRYSLTDLAIGQHTVWIERPFYVPAAYAVDVVDLGEVTLDMEIAAAGRIHGHLTNASGPVADALVSIGEARSTTNAEGEFLLVHVRPGRWSVTGTSSADGSVSATVEVTAGTTVEQDLTFPAGGTIQGRVTRGMGSASATEVVVHAAGRVAVTDAEGRYVLDGVPVGVHQMVVRALLGNYVPATRQVTVTAGGSVAADFDLVSQTVIQRPVEGTITDAATGAPLAAFVRFEGCSNPATGGSGVTGNYAISAVWTTCTQMSVTRGGYLPFSQTVDMNQLELVFDAALVPTAVIAGQIVEVGSGVGVEGVEVVCNGDVDVTAPGGWFLLDGVTPGPLHCELTGSRCHDLTSPSGFVPINPGEVRSLTLDAHRYAGLSVHTRDASDGRSLPAVMVEAAPERALSNDSGLATFTCRPPGTYNVIGWLPGYASANARVTVPLAEATSGGTVDAWLDLIPSD